MSNNSNVTELHPPCANVKTNRTMLFAFMAFIVGWCSWLSLSYINIKLDSRVAFATINVKLVQIQKDLVQIKQDNANRNKIIDFIDRQNEHRKD